MHAIAKSYSTIYPRALLLYEWLIIVEVWFVFVVYFLADNMRLLRVFLTRANQLPPRMIEYANKYSSPHQTINQ